MDNYVVAYYVPFVQKVPSAQRTSKYQENVALGAEIALTKGITGSEWQCLYELGMQESGWNHLATNKSSGAFGIPQSLPASKLDSYGDRYSPRVQIEWMIDYVFQRYGTPCKALSFQLANDWY